MKKLTASDAWQKLIDKYEIVTEIEENGYFEISASKIKEFKEPRLMAKWDSKELLPKPLKDNGINILSISRSSYLLSDFLLYHKLPQSVEQVRKISTVPLTELQTIDVDNVTSETAAVNILQISGILEDFLGLDSTDKLYSTFDGRMSSGSFSFRVDTFRDEFRVVTVDRAQLEIDGGFESNEYVVILEAKNVLHEDFHVRQLYYPFRLWEEKVTKPIRLIFSVYTNKIFRLFEYSFREKENYSSIELLQSKYYSLEDTSISPEDICDVIRNIDESELISDEMSLSNSVPFIQADNFERIITLLENMYDNPMTGEEIEELMQFTKRQKDYYFNAGRYLGLFEKYTDAKQIYYKLTDIGIDIFKKDYRERQLALVKLILTHKIFYKIFKIYIDNQIILSGTEVAKILVMDNICSLKVAKRRARTVISWFNWVINLTKI